LFVIKRINKFDGATTLFNEFNVYLNHLLYEKYKSCMNQVIIDILLLLSTHLNNCFLELFN